MPKDINDWITEDMLGGEAPRVPPDLMPHGPLCARCYSEDSPGNHVEFACTHDPVRTQGAIGMYHCPDCGAMVLAGHAHGPICRHCAGETTYPGEERRHGQPNGAQG